MTRVRIFLALLLSLPAAAASQSVPTPGAEAAARTISPEDLEARLRVIAHDSMRGRDTPSPELEETAQWIADQFRSFGLRPGGDDGSYIQTYTVQTMLADFGRSEARVQGGGRLEFGADLGLPFGPAAAQTVTGPVVVISGSEDWRERLQAAEIDGKHVVLVSSPGRGGAWSPAADEMTRFMRRMGNPASVIVPTNRSANLWRSYADVQRRTVGVGIAWNGSGRAPVLEIRDRSLGSLLAGRGPTPEELRGEFRGNLRIRHLPDLTVTLTIRNRILNELTAPNTVGILPGSDPDLRDQYVVFSAHMDHEGVGSADADGDSIYNGADDNGSGTVTVVELAQAFAELSTPPRRSLLFLAVSGEEKGLWGSEYFTGQPPVATEKMVADLNLDMVGRNWRDTVAVIGRNHSDLGATLDLVSRRHPELEMTAIDDPWPQEGLFTRSDHYNFARRGVPALFFFSGTHEDYHRPGDEVEKIDFEKMARIGRLIFYVGLEVANRDEPPRWDPESYQEIVGAPR